ncbi:hypothetical protein BCR32DRAFT_276261 [Anaeromyces robustus]|uniref:REM-1 domain-containing protein n=1 Tax=Anaeromyces robustus TaxID=1754192 RepID=A0A1Y1XI78_9FUNG|nr:hypothetical protein BCR32DRAFT_276261 [Anaeromyces robustus]|eukprot:ORX85468.1 hypothetical protein BCR32DRAFT_276261 [Anaeromyces robustus]
MDDFDNLMDIKDKNFLAHQKLKEEKAAAISKLQEKIKIEEKIKAGAELMLQVSETSQKGDTIERSKVEQRIEEANKKINQLMKKIEFFKNLPDHKEEEQPKKPRRIDHKEIQAQVEECLSNLENELLEPVQQLETLNKLIGICRLVGDIRIFTHIKTLLDSLRYTVVSKTKEVRANTFRLLRYLVYDKNIICTMLAFNYDISLIRDNKFEIERTQALKLVRKFIDTPKGVKLIPQSIVYILISVIEQLDDKLRPLCMETLNELAIRNVKLVASCGGIKIIFSAMTEGPMYLTEMNMLTVIYLLDTEKTRNYIKPEVDLEIIISAFIDVYSKNNYSEEQLKLSSKAILALFKSWTGMTYLCFQDKRAINIIVETLRISRSEARKTLLQMIFDLFQLKVPKWFNELIKSKKKSIDINSLIAKKKEEKVNEEKKLHFINHYHSILLLVFKESGLFEALLEVAKDEQPAIAYKAIILIDELLMLCNKLLPVRHTIQLCSLPTLFKNATNFEDEVLRHSANDTLSYFNNIKINKAKSITAQQMDEIEKKDKIILYKINETKGRTQRQIENVKMIMGYNIDETHFRNLITDTQVLTDKDFTKWNWNIIQDLIKGPLMNHKRLEETIKTTKFIKRIISFYRPLSHQFSDILKKKNVKNYVEIGCELITNLVATGEGIRLLSENKFLQQISECLLQLDPFSGITDQNQQIFSKERMEKTLTSEYFTFIGILSKSIDGIKLLEKFKIFHALYCITELRNGREDLIRTIVTSLDYNINSHSRIILSKIMTSTYKHTRLFATDYLQYLLRSGVNDFWDWGIRYLSIQLYDPAIEVSKKAVIILDEACNNSKNLESLVKLSPNLEHLGENANVLLFRFLSSTLGFQYLSDFGFVEKKMDEWFEIKNEDYVMKMELILERAFNTFTSKNRSPDVNDVMEEEALSSEILPHFYGELTKTPQGCSLLERKGHLKHFVDFIRTYSNKNIMSTSKILKLKSVLWAVGHIGSTKNGISFLIEEGIVKNIIQLAENSTILSIKGTCFFVLGLIANTSKGCIKLKECGWETPFLPYNQVVSYCVPRETSKFLKIPKWDFYGSIINNDFLYDINIQKKMYDDTELKILKNIGSLSNHILSNASSKALSKIRIEKPEYFSSVKLLVGVYIIMSTYHYRITARRFIYELFEGVNYTRETVLSIEEYLKSSLNVSPQKSTIENSQTTQSTNDLTVSKLKQEDRNEKTISLVSTCSVDNNNGVVKQVLKPQHVQIGFNLD